MRPILALLLVAGLVGEELDLFGDGGRPEDQRVELMVEGGVSWRWWRMTVEADGAGGSLGEADYEYRERGFVEGGLRLDSRPWRLELAAAVAPADEDPSAMAALSGIFIGDDDWWELAPRFTLALQRREAELETALGSRAVRLDEQRLELGFDGQGGELAGTTVYGFLARRDYPALVGFRSDDAAVNFSTIDREFEEWRLGLGFGWDWSRHAFETRRRYLGVYGGLRGEIALLWTDIGAEAAAAARSATGRDRIVDDERLDLAGGLEVGFQWHRRSAELGEAGWRLTVGWRLAGEATSSDDSWSGDPGSDTLVLLWERYALETGPVARLAVVF